MEFTKRFNEALKNSGKTQTQIAKEISVTKQSVNDYKTGKCMPSIETLCLICKCLDITADYLLGLSDY